VKLYCRANNILRWNSKT